MHIVKAELLWTRICPLDCHYCGMVTQLRNSRSSSDWRLGMENLKSLGCRFVAIYGAEPLADFDKLPELIRSINECGMDSTVITSGVTPAFEKKLRLLHDAGLRSLTMSHDLCLEDKSSKLKSDRSLEGLTFFQSLGCRDVAVVVTLTRTNHHLLPEFVTRMSDHGIWTLFDFVHPDRGQEGTKCRGNAVGLKFSAPADLTILRGTLDQLIRLKAKGCLVHTSFHFVSTVSRDNFDVLRNFSWNCARELNFPAWVTISCDGKVFPCDDFQPAAAPFDMTKLYSQWNDFCDYWKPYVARACPGCCWNTHIDAHAIKANRISIGDYVHGIQTR